MVGGEGEGVGVAGEGLVDLRRVAGVWDEGVFEGEDGWVGEVAAGRGVQEGEEGEEEFEVEV